MEVGQIFKQPMLEQDITIELVDQLKYNCTGFVNINTDFCRISSVSSIYNFKN
jgi:hypothetical protein